jgi:hypothetical protein
MSLKKIFEIFKISQDLKTISLKVTISGKTKKLTSILKWQQMIDILKI